MQIFECPFTTRAASVARCPCYVVEGGRPPPVRVKLQRVNPNLATFHLPLGQADWWDRLKRALGTSAMKAHRERWHRFPGEPQTCLTRLARENAELPACPAALYVLSPPPSLLLLGVSPRSSCVRRKCRERLTLVAADQHERMVACYRAIGPSIDHSPWQINFIFIALFKSNLDHGPYGGGITAGSRASSKTTEQHIGERHHEGRCQDG